MSEKDKRLFALIERSGPEEHDHLDKARELRKALKRVKKAKNRLWCLGHYMGCYDGYAEKHPTLKKVDKAWSLAVKLEEKLNELADLLTSKDRK